MTGRVKCPHYCISPPLVSAFVSRWFAVSIYVLVALIWVIPDKRIEHVLAGDETK